MTEKGFSPNRNLAQAWFSLAGLFLVSVAIFSGTPRVAAQTAVPWLPVSKEDLDLKDNALAPGEPAIILYREVQTDSAKSYETHYTRIKILKDSGKEYANVEIPYVEKEIEVGQIQARTIAPDGKPSEFSGTIFDRAAVKSKRFNVTVKSFTLPDVQVGSIIEYSYSLHWHRSIPDEFKNPGKYRFDGAFAWPASQWTVPQDLFARRMHFVLHPFSNGTHLEIQLVGLPEKMGKPQTQRDGSVQWEIENIPAYHHEDHAPPENVLKGRVEIFYVVGMLFSNRDYWVSHARHAATAYQKFFSKSKAVQEEAAKLVAGADSPEAKLRKLYDRAQQLRFVSYERSRTEKEQKQENLKPNKTAEEVLTRGYAYANESNLLFVALAREAGFVANPVMVTSRNRSFFLENIFDTGQLNAMVVEVQTGSKTYYLDPATLHCPFGLLPWAESDTMGIRLDQNNGALVAVPAAKSADAVIERRSSFKMDNDGNLQGKLDVTFRGQEALSRRLVAVSQDEAGRRKELEDEVTKWLPQNSVIKLATASGWDGSETPLQASFEVQVPNFGSTAGGRMLLPAILFHSGWEKSFQSPQREHPVYLDYGHQESDDVTLELPGNLTVERTPSPQGLKEKFASYQFSTELQGTSLKMKRQVAMDGYYFSVAQYPRLRDFYGFIRSNDEELTVLRASSATAAK
jgi:transglutaminase-like putative cysteine protease